MIPVRPTLLFESQRGEDAMPDFAKQYEMMYEEQLLKIRVMDLIPDALAAYDSELRRRGTPECQRKLAEPGFACAQFNLGVACDRGKGVPQDYVQAAVWYRKAAEQGFASAQLNLGAAFCEGQGVPQDYAEAYFWLNLAASGKPEGIRVEEVVRMRDDAASHLTGVALIQTQERARKATEEHFSTLVGDNARAPKTDVAKRSRWPSVVGWILIVIGVWGGLQKLTTGEGNLNTTLVTIALFLAGGIGLIRRSGKFAGIGIALVLLVGIIAGLIVGPPAVQTVAETLAGSCGIDESGKAKILRPFNTDGVVTYVSRNDSAYTSVYLLEDATGVMEVIPSKK